LKIRCKYDELVSPDVLKAHPKNRNKHPKEQIARLAKILDYQGWRYPVKVSLLSGYVTSGHGRIEAARHNEWEKVPVNYQEYESEEQEYADVQADNAIASWAELDLAGINTDIVDLGPDFDIDLLGIKDFVIEPADKYGDDEGEDGVPAVPANPHCRVGDLFTVGRHRLVVGDCTDPKVVARLMGGEKADMVFTDPPYNVGFQYNQHDDRKMPYAQWESQCKAWLQQWQQLAPKVVLTPGCKNLELWCRISEPAHIGCWIKENGNTTGRITYLWIWEPIIFLGKFERKRASDVFTHHVNSGFLRDGTTGCHPCPKPLTLWQDVMENFSDSSDVVFEPFCGSGTTIIAAEKTGRRAFATEIDPLYCDVILDRFAKFSGIDPVREDGVAWSTIKANG
jgi:DNA modification methylase